MHELLYSRLVVKSPLSFWYLPCPLPLLLMWKEKKKKKVALKWRRNHRLPPPPVMLWMPIYRQLHPPGALGKLILWSRNALWSQNLLDAYTFEANVLLVACSLFTNICTNLDEVPIHKHHDLLTATIHVCLMIQVVLCPFSYHRLPRWCFSFLLLHASELSSLPWHRKTM